MVMWFITCKIKITKKERTAEGPRETPADTPTVLAVTAMLQFITLYSVFPFAEVQLPQPYCETLGETEAEQHI